jgi:hypothetical protein
MQIPRGGGIDCQFKYFSEFKFIFETALGYVSGGLWTCFDEKHQRQNFSCHCPFKLFHMKNFNVHNILKGSTARAIISLTEFDAYWRNQSSRRGFKLIRKKSPTRLKGLVRNNFDKIFPVYINLLYAAPYQYGLRQ